LGFTITAGALPARCDWRWLLAREDSPWYATLRLFRQSRLDDWPEAFSRVAVALTWEVAAREALHR
jgi:hypothetical protein